MVFNCPKAATQHRNQHILPYYEATVEDKQKIKRGRQTKDKNICVN